HGGGVGGKEKGGWRMEDGKISRSPSSILHLPFSPKPLTTSDAPAASPNAHTQPPPSPSLPSTAAATHPHSHYHPTAPAASPLESRTLPHQTSKSTAAPTAQASPPPVPAASTPPPPSAPLQNPL